MRFREIRARVGVSPLTVFLAVIAVIVFNAFLLYVYRKNHKKQVNEQLQAQVNSAVSQYFRLADNETR